MDEDNFVDGVWVEEEMEVGWLVGWLVCRIR